MENSPFLATLTALNLSPEQAAIYTSLLKTGPQTAVQLAKNTSVKRTYVYKLAEALIAQGLVRQEIKGRTATFVAESPDRLLDLAAALKTKADQTSLNLENILPSLKSLFAATDSRPIITYYEGIEGIKKVYLDTLKEQQPIYALVETSEVNPDVYQWVTTAYVQKRVQANIRVQAIVSTGPNTPSYTSLDEQELRQTKTIDSTQYPLKHEINIYGSKVAIINHHREEKLIAIIIDQPLVSTTFRAWFDLTWNRL